ncbi:MAG: hypothetical protein U5L45_16260 [Saprospiraceae bacterium]|nr:hypothetical protein [Saprospiraceae bacterium]
MDYTFFIGGLYFYLINCLFIGLATFITARITGYHKNCSIKKPDKTTIGLWYFFIVLMILPSVYIAYVKWKDEKQKTQPTQTEQGRIEVLERKVKVLDSLLRVRGLNIPM